ncbi:MAG: uracil-xanthine permease family protein [Saccharofermentans sp.]|nr:uracil-xanthine permease family protein [Saccharofermentans sp.]
MGKSSLQDGAVYDAKSLGAGRVIVLGFQHMFAMFGSTVLVPILTGLSVSATLLFAGLGTLLFHLLSKRKVPAFLGSSFAFLAGYFAIAPNREEELLPYACFGVALAGLVYLILAGLIKAFGVNRVMKFFPPIVTGPIIIAIGLCLSATAINSCSTNWLVAVVAILIIVICNIWGKGMIKIIPILLGVVGACALCVILTLTTGQINGDYYTIAGNANLQLFSVASINTIKDAAWFGLPFEYKNTVFNIFTSGTLNTSLLITAIITIVPISLATIVEHIGDISAISSTVGKNYIADPGLHRTLMGDGLATTLASLFGAPANTTYGENTGVLTLSKVYDPFVVRLAALFAICFSISPKLAACISAIPTPVVGGISLVLYGMISAVGVRNVVENKIDFGKARNVIIAAIILVLSIGIQYCASGAIKIPVGKKAVEQTVEYFSVDGEKYVIDAAGSVNIPAEAIAKAGSPVKETVTVEQPLVVISLSGLAVGSLIGIILNAVLPGKDYVFEDNQEAARAKDSTIIPDEDEKKKKKEKEKEKKD